MKPPANAAAWRKRLRTEHWRSVSANPIAKEVMALVARQLAEIYRGAVYDVAQFWDSEIRGRSLLDIGVVEHTMDFAEREGWRHGQFAALASRAVGVDILAAEVARLRERGYDIKVCDATSDVDLGERFDVVYAGDVIEHVDDPVKLIRFAARHVAPGGRILVSTPCPFWWQNIRSMVSDNTYIGNVDHIRWVTPVNALEIGHRAGAPLIEYRTVETSGHSAFRRLVMSAVNRILGRNELFAWAYIYTFSADRSRV